MLKSVGKVFVGIFAVITVIALVVFIVSFESENYDVAARAFIAFCIILPIPVFLNLAIETDFFENFGSPFGF